MAGVPHGGNMWKNIAIGIGTTVVAYLIVHFITDKKDEGKELKKKKEAVEKAWHSMNEYAVTMSEKFESIGCFSCNPEEMKKEMLRELDQIEKSLGNIKDEKEQDEKLKTLLDRTINMYEAKKPVLAGYYDSMAILRRLPESGKVESIAGLQKRLFEKMEHIELRDTTELRNLINGLEKDYKIKLETTASEKTADYKLIAGKWQIGCDGDLNLYNFRSDSTFTLDTWEGGKQSGGQLTGKWDFDTETKQLFLTYDDGDSDIFTIAGISEKMMTFFSNKFNLSLGACPVRN